MHNHVAFESHQQPVLDIKPYLPYCDNIQEATESKLSSWKIHFFFLQWDNNLLNFYKGMQESTVLLKIHFNFIADSKCGP